MALAIAKQQAIAAHVPPAEVDWLLQEVVGLDRLSRCLGNGLLTIGMLKPF